MDDNIILFTTLYVCVDSSRTVLEHYMYMCMHHMHVLEHHMHVCTCPMDFLAMGSISVIALWVAVRVTTWAVLTFFNDLAIVTLRMVSLITPTAAQTGKDMYKIVHQVHAEYLIVYRATAFLVYI